MELDPIKLLYGLKARKFLILSFALIFGGIAFFIGVNLPKQYEASAKVQINSLQKNTLTGRSEQSLRVSEFLGQQAAIGQSRTVALVVIDQLIEEGFFSMADFEASWREETGGELVAGNDARLWAADQLTNGLTVTGDALASSLLFSFSSNDASHSAKLANSFANAYMATVLNQRQRRSARNAQNFSDETLTLAEDVEEAKQKLSDYRASSGIVGLGAARLEAAEVELAALTTRLGDARADYTEAQTLIQQARSLGPTGLLNLPLPNENLPGRQSQVRLGAVLIQLNRIAERFGENYPDYIELAAERGNLENNIMTSIENRFSYATSRVRELTKAADDQKQIVLSLQESKQTFDDLEKSIDSRRGTLDLVNARSLQESLQSRVDVVDVLLLYRAVPATKTTLPPLTILIALGVVMGLGFGIVLAVFIELLTRRIRVNKTVHQILDVPVLAELPLKPYVHTSRKLAA